MYSRIKAAIYSRQPVRRLVDFLVAQVLFSLPQGARKRLFYGKDHYCPICQSQLREFLRLHRVYNLWCPVCRSLSRHRFVWLFIEKSGIFTQDTNIAMLHFAPEIGLTERFSRIPKLEYISADIQDPAAMVKMDISNILYPDCSFDLIYCSHVLEHVPDDARALSELWRVLKPGGKAIIIVPITTTMTVEDPTITDPVMREKLFGQHDHVRRYGPDFIDRLISAGFETEIYHTIDVVGEGDIGKMGLDVGDRLFSCVKHEKDSIIVHHTAT